MEKKIKFLFIAFTFVFMFALASCDNTTIHRHNYVDGWKITVNPTKTENGKATKTCDCGQSLEQILPNLQDSNTWTLVEQTEATCTKYPTDIYESEYGTVKIVTGELIDHNLSDWFISVDPTVENTGVYRKECTMCDLFEEQTIPALSDETVWTKVETVEAECDVEGYDLYESSYGTVKVSFGTLPHNYPNEWTVVENPTYEDGGLAIKECPDCENVDELVLPNLNDTDYWTLVDSKDADYSEAGYAKFESEDLEYTLVIAKLVAPYAGKTYSSFAVDAEDDGVQTNGVVSIETVWTNAFVTLDENGVGLGTAHPFRGENVFTIVNPLTGELTIKQTNYHTDEETGEPVLDPEKVSTYKAYVDLETGLVVRANSSSFGYVHVLTPFEVGVDDENAKASSWDNALAIEYTFEENTYKMFCYNNVVYFNVEFVDENGDVVATDACYNSNYLYVLNADEEEIAAFAFNGEKLVVADGFEGTYTNDTNTLVVSGYGVATLNGNEGTYVVNDTEDYDLGVYVNNEFYEVTLDGATYTANKPMVTITFDAGVNATVPETDFNKNVVATLPVPTNADYTFKGWFYDAECQNAVEEEFIPTVDCTLYANWKVKVIINLVNVVDGDEETLVLGVGDVIGDYLPEYNLDLENNKLFKGWYLDAECNTSLPEEVELTAEDSNISIYAKWADIPAYYGTYKGVEIWNGGYGNSSVKNLTIDENGKISGYKSGVVVDYDEDTQKVSWKTSATSSTTYSFYYNDELGIIAGLYNNYNIGNDYMIFSRTDADGKATATYGVKAPQAPNSSSRSWYAQFVNMTTDLGDKEIFLYNNYIYDTFTATDAQGNPLTAATVRNSKTLIVKDALGNIIVAVASEGESFVDDNDTIDLDPYFGTYKFGDEDVVLNGCGNIKYGEKVGTYALALTGSTYQFDVYLEDNTEYYELSLNGENCTLVKTMVNITFEEGTYANIEDISINKNITYTLPTLEADEFVFNGWFYDEACTEAVGTTITPKADDTLYALWKEKVVLTINPNNDDEQATVDYSKGDTATVENPVKPGYTLEGWYTTSTFDENTKWAADADVKLGSVSSLINEDVEIFAKWVEAPIYSNSYASMGFEGTDELGNKLDRYTWNATFTIDPYGNSPKGTSWPFASGNISVQNYNPETNYIEFHITGSYSTEIYSGYIDPVTKFVVLSDTKGANQPLVEIMVLNPFDAKNTYDMWSDSYWNSGKTRAITYVSDELTYNIFIMDNKVYYGVTFENETKAIRGEECYNSPILYVKDADNNIIAKFAYDGETLQPMDGNEGTYTDGVNTLKIDGVKKATLNGVDGLFVVAPEGSSYDLDVYVNNIFYEVTLNKEEDTCTINTPMVKIVFDAGDKATVEAKTVNRNIQITLPTLTHDNYIFRGWYSDADCTTAVDMNYIPANNATLYAKWDAKVTLTVVYGNGLTDEILSYGAGDTVAPVEPSFTNGKVFNGWYLDAECTNPYTIGTITENTTIYCKWMDAVAMFGSYVGFNLYGSGSKTSASLNANQEFTAAGDASGKKSGTVTNYDPETGIFYIVKGSTTYYAVYDEASGTVAFAWGSSSTSLNSDLYLLFKKEANTNILQSANLTSSGYTKLVTVSFKDGTTENYLIMNDRIYSGVTWNVSDDYTADKIGNAASYTIYDRNGNELLTK